MFEMEFKFSELDKSIVFRCLRANRAVDISNAQHTFCVTNKVNRPLSRKMKKKKKKKARKIPVQKKSKSVNSLKYMDELFSTNDVLLLESCQLYIIRKYKATNCCKIEAVIQMYLEKFTRKPLCQSLFLNKVAA